ncbi:head-closure protein [Vibrio phage 1.015.O._10N.222.51.E5]|nr:head-closure protein [Vibrio phage 1.015.O._10N.222.51.E5]
MIEHPKFSCLLSGKLSWHDTNFGDKWTRDQQAIKLSTHLYNKVGQDYEAYPSSVLTTKLRVPGSGDVLQLHYKGEPGKPFKFLGVDMTFRAQREK